MSLNKNTLVLTSVQTLKQKKSRSIRDSLVSSYLGLDTSTRFQAPGITPETIPEAEPRVLKKKKKCCEKYLKKGKGHCKRCPLV